MRRGEVWEANVGGTAGRRPVLILTRSAVIPYLSKVVVAEITTQSKGYPTQVPIGLAANLRRDSWVSAESLHSFPTDRLTRYVGELPRELLDRVSLAIVFGLALADREEPPPEPEPPSPARPTRSPPRSGPRRPAR